MRKLIVIFKYIYILYFVIIYYKKFIKIKYLIDIIITNFYKKLKTYFA